MPRTKRVTTPSLSTCTSPEQVCQYCSNCNSRRSCRFNGLRESGAVSLQPRLRMRITRAATGLLLASLTLACEPTRTTSPVRPSLVAQEVTTVRAELPRTYLRTSYVLPTGSTILVRAGEALQAAIDRAQPGDVILLEAGAT